MLWLYRFISGYLYVEFSGDVSEMILNLCAKNGISLWNSKRVKNKIRCCMSVREFKMLPSVARKNGIRVHIINKCGLPFFTEKYRKRFGLWVGIALFFIILNFMSCFVWSIEVSGNSQVGADEIINLCEKIGIYEGIPKNKIDPQLQKQRLLLESDKLAWASLNLEGCQLTVNVTESKKKEEDGNAPTNLKAKADGRIKKIDVVSGNCVVKVGDIVNKGDVLVSGIIENADSTRFVHSAGTVTAVTEREITVSAGYEKTLKEKSGKIKHKTVLEFFGIKIPLYLGKENAKYEEKLEVSEAKLLGHKLPLRLYRKEFEFFDERNITVSENEVKAILESLLKDKMKKENIENYEVKNRTFVYEDGKITLKAVISAEEDIVYQEILLFSTGN